MNDDQMKELRRCTEALAQVLAMCSIGKKPADYLKQIHDRQKAIYDPTPEPSPLWKLSATEALARTEH